MTTYRVDILRDGEDQPAETYDFDAPNRNTAHDRLNQAMAIRTPDLVGALYADGVFVTTVRGSKT